jgi:DNA-binding LytR/AlgR family response regulator
MFVFVTVVSARERVKKAALFFWLFAIPTFFYLWCKPASLALMENAKVLIVEDEIIIAADISMMLSNLGYDVTGIIPRGEDALKSIEATRPDLVLMDISLKGQMDGISTALQIRDAYQIPLIFLTANADDDTFARAKAAQPYAFMAKPFQEADLSRTIELALQKITEEKHYASQAMALDAALPKEDSILADRIFVRYKDRMVKVLLQDILFAEADRSYCKIHTAEAEYLMTLPLGAFEEKLQSRDFLRIHRSHIINVTKVDAVTDHYNYVHIGKFTLPVSRGFQEALAQCLRVI